MLEGRDGWRNRMRGRFGGISLRRRMIYWRFLRFWRGGLGRLVLRGCGGRSCGDGAWMVRPIAAHGHNTFLS